MLARVLAVMGMISVGFLSFLIITSNPFQRLLPQVPTDGRDLNPLLQDIGLIVHPPMLYMGYVGFSVAFAFAIAACSAAAWTPPGRAGRGRGPSSPGLSSASASPGLVVGLLRTGLGRLVVLGPGGKRLVHALAGGHRADPLAGGHRETRGVQELDRAAGHRRLLAEPAGHLPGAFRGADSVHAFAADPSRGMFILIFLLFVVGGSLTLFALRAPVVSQSGGFALWSRETLLLANNLVLVVAASMILLGTLYPLVLDALTGPSCRSARRTSTPCSCR
jgi:cytochrome c-type biogenesis protein CcmF